MATQIYQINPDTPVTWSVARAGYTTQSGSFTMPDDNYSITVALVEDPAQCWAIFDGGTVNVTTDQTTHTNVSSPVVKTEITGDPTSMQFYHTEANPVNSISYIDGSTLTTCFRMFKECYNLTTVPLLDTSSATATEEMFMSCNSLTNIPALDLSNVTAAYSMFEGCRSITEIPQNIDFSHITLGYGMFKDCHNLESLSDINLSQISDAKEMFYLCSNLKSIKSLNFSSATSITDMFYSCNSLEYVGDIDISSAASLGYKPSVSGRGIFSDLDTLETVGTISCAGVVYLSNNVTPSSTNAFYNCTSLKNLGGLSGLGPNLSTSYNHYLVLTSCPLTYQSALNVFNTIGTAASSSYVKQISFKNDTYCMLTDADIAIATGKNWTVREPNSFFARWDGGGTANATIGGTEYTSLSSPISRSTYFPNTMTHITFTNNTSITNLNYLISRYITSLNSTFSGCTALTHIVSCNGAFIDDVTDAFTGCTSLTDIGGFVNLGLGFTSGHTVDFSDCPLTHDSAVNIINYLATVSLSDCKVKFAYSTYDTLTLEEIAVATDKGWTIERDISNIWVIWTGGGTTVATIGGTEYTDLSSPVLKSSYEGNMTRLYLNSNSSITSLDVADTSYITDMSSMFSQCNNLEYISQIDTSSATNVRLMFYVCPSLTTIPQLDMMNVENVEDMLYACTSLANIEGFTNLGQSFTSDGSTIGHHLNLSSCAYLTHNSAVNILNTVGTVPSTVTDAVITFEPSVYDLLTSAEIAVATAKNWEVKRAY